MSAEIETVGMKMAKASDAEWEALCHWFNARERNNKPVPAWRRVVFGYQVLVTNSCDPDKSFLDWKPEISAAIEAYRK